MNNVATRDGVWSREAVASSGGGHNAAWTLLYGADMTTPLCYWPWWDSVLPGQLMAASNRAAWLGVAAAVQVWQ